jgi:hypothetical protein
MSSLLGSLVERSVRAPQVAAADPGAPSPDAATGRQREGEPARDSRPGEIVPRRRSRFEPQRAEPVLGETEERVDTTSPPTVDPPPRRVDEPAAVRGAPAGASRDAHAPSGAAPRHAPLESAPRRIPATAPPGAVRVAAPPTPPVRLPVAAADGASPPKGRASDLAPRPEPPVAAREGVATAATVSSAAAAPASPPGRSATDAHALVSPARSSRAPVARIAVSPSAEPAELATVRAGEIEPVRAREPLREPAKRSETAGSRLPSDRPPVPSVQVSIGRVEVRAVFVPPPSAARRPAPAPALSLDDYLKQREKG